MGYFALLWLPFFCFLTLFFFGHGRRNGMIGSSERLSQDRAEVSKC